MTLPMVPRTTMTTTAIRTRMRAYSTMLCPRWEKGSRALQRRVDIAVKLYSNPLRFSADSHENQDAFTDRILRGLASHFIKECARTVCLNTVVVVKRAWCSRH